MDWLRDGHDWPNRDASRFVKVGGTRWHVQQMGEGPDVLLLHGSGATTHSYASLMSDLAQDFRVTAIDLPGHGFSSPLFRKRPTLDSVSEGIAALLKQEAIEPRLVVGHSAGAAISVNMTAIGLLKPEALVAINGAFYPFPGFAGHIFPVAAKLLFLNPLVPHIFAYSAGNRRRIRDLLHSTGSKLGDKELDFYQRALRSNRHVEGTLSMMANWDLIPLERQLRMLEVPLLQIIGGRDGTIAPAAAQKTAALLQKGQLQIFETCGHLVHEERPADVSNVIRDFANACGSTAASKRLRESN